MGLGATCGEGFVRASATLGDPSLGGSASRGRVEANLDPVLLSFTDNGLKPNGPAPEGDGGGSCLGGWFEGRGSTFFWTETGGGGEGGGGAPDGGRNFVCVNNTCTVLHPK